MNWEVFFGNNYNRIECNQRFGGSVSFTEHIGKPLSDELWKDLVTRLGVIGIRIYKPNNEIHLFHIASPRAHIFLDENNLVTEISYAR